MRRPLSESCCASLLVVMLELCCYSSVQAHDFWLQPNEFWIELQAVTPLTLQVGHGPLRQRSPIPMRRITRFEAFAPNGTVIDLRGALHLGEAASDGTLRFDAAGAYVLVLATDNRAQSHLPAIRFNDYLQVEGLTPALEQRARTQQMSRDGSENYLRLAKSILQAGPSNGSSSAHVTQPLGLTLEIVPELNPYTEPRHSNLPVRVIYEGRPLAGALVKLTNLDHDDTPFETHLTDQAGRASFTMPQAGNWMLNVIWTKPLPSSSETDFETVFSSLSFGFGRYRPNRAAIPSSTHSKPSLNSTSAGL
jgi:uncharacterized GH25 family protein